MLCDKNAVSFLWWNVPVASVALFIIISALSLMVQDILYF